jgi:hypothetical protein
MSAILFDQLCAKGEPVYLRNTLHEARGEMGNLMITVTDPNSHRGTTLCIPKNSVVCVNDQVTSESARVCNDLRRFISRGFLEVMSSDAYAKMLETNPNIEVKSTEELNKMLAWVNNESAAPAPKASTVEVSNNDVARIIPIRANIAGLVSKAQLGSDTDISVLEDLKALAPYNELELNHMRSSLATMDGTMQFTKQYIVTL